MTSKTNLNETYLQYEKAVSQSLFLNTLSHFVDFKKDQNYQETKKTPCGV
jgi:hypothetical protein